MRLSSTIEIEEYLEPSGRSPVREWFDRLDPPVAARVAVALARLAHGHWSQVKSVGGGLHELRMDFGPGYRVYFGCAGPSLVILVAAGSKAQQQKDITQARTRWKRFMQQRQTSEQPWH